MRGPGRARSRGWPKRRCRPSGQAGRVAWTGDRPRRAIENVRLDVPEDDDLIEADLDKEGKRKGVLTVSVTNLTGESRRFDVHQDRSLYVLDQDGNDSLPHTSFGLDDPDVFAKAVKAGAVVTGDLAFEYYADATAFRVLVCEEQAPANHYQGLVAATVLYPSTTDG
ncbi:hypothetical protein ACFQ8C_13960 [Streptomyces sp. NPDC056503]|uniref:hypothetical protein n=1 Tax=Streptomyces sp. NPDC056503 TaxID=3345842 RepID=UPI0036BE2925